MSDLGGVYRHRGVTLTWNARGLTLLRPGGRAEGWSWLDVQAARQVPERSGEIQILVRPRRAGGALEAVDVAMASGEDANRLMTTVNWFAAAPTSGTDASE